MDALAAWMQAETVDGTVDKGVERTIVDSQVYMEALTKSFTATTKQHQMSAILPPLQRILSQSQALSRQISKAPFMQRLVD